MMHPTTSTRILLFVAGVGCWTVVFSNARRLHQPLATVLDIDKQQKHHAVAAAVYHTADGVATMEHNNRRRLIRHRRVQAGSTPYAADTTGYSSGYDAAYSNYADPSSQQQQSYTDPYATYEQTQTYQTQPQDQTQPQAAQSQYQYQGQPQAQAQPQAAQGRAQNQYQQSYDTYASYEQTQTQAQSQVQGQYQYQTQFEAQAVSQAWAQAQTQAAAQTAAAQARPQSQQAQQGPYTYLSSPYSTDTFTRKQNTYLRSEGSMGPYVVSSTTMWVGHGEDYDDDYDSSLGDEEFALNDDTPPRQQRPDLNANHITNYTDSEDPQQPEIFVSEILSEETYSAQEF